MENLTKIEIVRKFLPKWKFFENLTKIVILLKEFDQNKNFSKISRNMIFLEFFGNFDQNRNSYETKL